jgi:replicative superfamily II helicase
LEQNFVGIKAKAGSIVMKSKMNEICFEKVKDLIRENRQIMVFVHSRKETVNTAMAIRQEAYNSGDHDLFNIKEDPQYGLYIKEVQKSKNKELKELFDSGMGVHHAGMARSDRLLTEKLFEKGAIRVLCCTATLAWGIYIP